MKRIQRIFSILLVGLLVGCGADSNQAIPSATAEQAEFDVAASIEFPNCSWGPPGNAIWQPTRKGV